MQTTKSKRIQYDTITYGHMTGELSRLIDSLPHLMPNRDTWDIEGDWSAAGELIFIDKSYMASFAPFVLFDCRVIKLLNHNKPAVRMSFFVVHRYWVLKDAKLPLDEKEQRIAEYINMNTVQIETLRRKAATMTGTKHSATLGQIAQLEDERTNWTTILHNLEDYELAISNYEREHVYTNINIKYELPNGDYDNEQHHLLSNQRDRDGNITQTRQNIVFVDPLEVLRFHPHQHKQVVSYLNRFSLKTTLGKNRLYARPKQLLLDVPSTDTPSDQLAVPHTTTDNVHNGKKPGKVTFEKYTPENPPSYPLFPDWQTKT